MALVSCLVVHLAHILSFAIICFTCFPPCRCPSTIVPAPGASLPASDSATAACNTCFESCRLKTQTLHPASQINPASSSPMQRQSQPVHRQPDPPERFALACGSVSADRHEITGNRINTPSCPQSQHMASFLAARSLYACGPLHLRQDAHMAFSIRDVASDGGCSHVARSLLALCAESMSTKPLSGGTTIGNLFHLAPVWRCARH
jgi:hypothetical protein